MLEATQLGELFDGLKANDLTKYTHLLTGKMAYTALATYCIKLFVLFCCFKFDNFITSCLNGTKIHTVYFF